MDEVRRHHLLLAFLLLPIIFSSLTLCQCFQPYKGRWTLLAPNVGISAMHIALLPNDRLIMFDRTDSGPSNITASNGKCRKDPNDLILKLDCFAHSVEFNPVTLSVRPLTLQTDTWCSSGALSPDGVLVQNGGFNDGERAVRFFTPCSTCDWNEDLTGLLIPRWYASSLIMPNGKIIVVGGRGHFNYEFVPKTTVSDHKLYDLPFLRETTDIPWENNLYPFLHVCPDGNLFIFANDRSILLDYVNNRVLRYYPRIPGAVSRNYPSTGSSVLLPLKLKGQTQPQAEVLICGGTRKDSYHKSTDEKVFFRTSKSCGRMVITAPEPNWVMEDMPIRRAMGDMIILPTTDVLIINGARRGSAGWDSGRDPVLHPVLYKPDFPPGVGRFEILNPSTIPRMYHSVAHLLSDGRVLVAGSNPHELYNFTTTLFPTDLSVEAFSPPYLTSRLARPTITGVEPGMHISYNQLFSVTFTLTGPVNFRNALVTMIAPSFTTHSMSMHQRLLVLDIASAGPIPGGLYVFHVHAPMTISVAPPGYYILFVVHSGIPSQGRWLHIN